MSVIEFGKSMYGRMDMRPIHKHAEDLKCLINVFFSLILKHYINDVSVRFVPRAVF